MDIDDILSEFDRGYVPSNVRDYQDLTKWWISERAAPEILQCQEALLERIMERVQRQIETIEEQTGNLDPKANFALIIVQTELERIKFLVRSYLRTRLHKIDKHALHILSNASLRTRLSASELTYLKTNQALLNNLYLSSFLRNFPESLRRLDDTAGGISMIEEPDLDSAVFIKVVKDFEIELDIGDEELELKKNDVFVIRYSAVKDAVERGDVELI